jgi:hypothetical protein
MKLVRVGRSRGMCHAGLSNGLYMNLLVLYTTEASTGRMVSTINHSPGFCLVLYVNLY